jgi:acylphosphatase
MNKRRVHLQIHGLVQGVSYRASARDEALRLGLTGQVRNLRNGEVEAIAEGPVAAVDAFIAWCHHGPEEARVTSVEVSPAAAGGAVFSTFQVVR